ncbi:MAG: hypothetical protein HGB10_08650, partial [Coriobacteriia bacterium]|nr:hypothetical protein [Coriobacteriia bacterium]
MLEPGPLARYWPGTMTSRSRDNLETTVAALTSEGLGANRVFAIMEIETEPMDAPGARKISGRID